MGDILDISGHKMATIGEDGKIHNVSGIVLGHVAANGDVYNNMGYKVGHFAADGYVYKGVSHIGTVHSDGRVYDYNNSYIGKVVGEHIESGGAALLLLIR